MIFLYYEYVFLISRADKLDMVIRRQDHQHETLAVPGQLIVEILIS